MNRMSPTDIAWLAGLMEGEASIGAWTQNQNRQVSSRYTKYARVEISSVDPDVIERIYRLTGIGKIHKHYDKEDRPNHKKSTTWRVAKAEEVLHLLCTVASYQGFSERRRSQVLEAIEAASETVQRKRSGKSFARKRS